MIDFKGFGSKVKLGAKKYGKEFAGAVHRNSPTLLSAVAIAGVIGSYVILWKTKDKIEEDINIRRSDLRDAREDFDDDEQLKIEEKRINKEFAKNASLHLLPFAVVSVSTIAAIIGSVTIGNRRFAAVSAAYTLAQNNMEEWKKKAAEIIGTGKIEKIDAATAQDLIEKSFPENEEDIISTGKGDTIFMDSWTGRYFRASIESVKKIVNDLNYRLICEEWINLNDLYYNLGLEACKAGNEFGWNIGYNGQVEIKMIPRIIERNGVETTVILLDYNVFLREKYF